MSVRLYWGHAQRLLRLRTFSSATSHPERRFSLVSILLGGAVAGTGKGYIWYINSDFKRAVDTVKPALGFLTDTRTELGKKAPSHVLSHLRQACKAYLAHLPGSGLLIDRGFDALDDVVDAHADEANAIIGAAAADVLVVVQRDGNECGTGAVVDVVRIMRRLLGDLQALGAKAGAPLAERLELERRAEQFKAGSAAAYGAVRARGADVSEALAGAMEKAKERMPDSSGVSSGVASAAGKVKRLIFPKSENE
ncbi:hypothetical protein HYPSUDRAFT_197842 [Hypholoma sublateritium FD-334 SS-4]|uniref:Uncharacterized protein n=1 Tax=Hypholoma sublateritium (strain FD-334 SS-4) TaxID=945553 RepID=A0A0D2P9U0_HYPSF|nr:hypothetical protein HYPSUDRAFT_197842 [Hypholoma sublateritium FD-334 SS-4]